MLPHTEGGGFCKNKISHIAIKYSQPEKREYFLSFVLSVLFTDTEGRFCSQYQRNFPPMGHMGKPREYHLLFSIIIARTFMDRPNRLMKPSASLWSYSSPVAKEAIDSLYRL